MAHTCDNIFIMRTFEEIFKTDFSTNLIAKNAASPKLAEKLLDTYYLDKLRLFIPHSLREHVVNIMRSKIKAKQIAIGFNSMPACNEFNKYHAESILRMLKQNKEVSEKMQLMDCEQIRGYVAKSYIKPYRIVEIVKKDLEDKSSGRFINAAKNKKLRERFERIRQIILSKNKQLEQLPQQQITSKIEEYSFSGRAYPKLKG